MVGGPGHLENTLKSIQRYVLGRFFISGFFLIGSWWLASQYLVVDATVLLGGLSAGWIVLTLIVGNLIFRTVTSPLRALSEAILHISPSPIEVKSPDIEKLRLGRELVAGLIRQVYGLNTNVVNEGALAGKVDLSLQQLPVVIISINVEGNIIFANAKALEFVGQPDIIGKNLYGLFDILFDSTTTLQDWLEEVRVSSITAQKVWRGVKISGYDESTKYVDLAASFVKQTGEGSEVLLTLFDETDVYTGQDNSLSFIALAVHELRTPLTILRGYIEVFEEELGTIDRPEFKVFMRKMRASAENLAAFVGNILDVAKIDQNQLVLHLNKEDWAEVLGGIIEDMQLRAEVHGKTIELALAKDLPIVGIDRISIAEVMTNLLDNAIKYSPDDKTTIKVATTLNKDGLVETTVQDFGVGIQESILPHLFEKFSRNYRNRASIGGTGLGLFLSKALVTAHGGNIWVRSHEGQGSIFGFTVLPFDKVADKDQSGDNGITRNAHGWIKNHSLSRR